MASWHDIESSKLHRLFYPQIAVVVSASYEGTIGGMPAIWAMPLSFNPPRVGVSIDPRHFTYHLMVSSGYFALNWLDIGMKERVSKLPSIKGGEVADKLSAAGFKVLKGKASPAPVIAEASAVVECKLLEHRAYGDHELMIGELLACYAIDDFSDYWSFKGYSPLLYIGSEGGDQTKPIFTTIRL